MRSRRSCTPPCGACIRRYSRCGPSWSGSPSPARAEASAHLSVPDEVGCQATDSPLIAQAQVVVRGIRRELLVPESHPGDLVQGEGTPSRRGGRDEVALDEATLEH